MKLLYVDACRDVCSTLFYSKMYGEMSLVHGRKRWIFRVVEKGDLQEFRGGGEICAGETVVGTMGVWGQAEGWGLWGAWRGLSWLSKFWVFISSLSLVTLPSVCLEFTSFSHQRFSYCLFSLFTAPHNSLLFLIFPALVSASRIHSLSVMDSPKTISWCVWSPTAWKTCFLVVMD